MNDELSLVTIEGRYELIVAALARNSDALGLLVEDNRSLWGLTIRATCLPGVPEVADLVLGNLSPATTFKCKDAGMPPFPDGYCVEEQLRYEKARDARDLSALLDDRIGTPLCYSLTLAIILYATGKMEGHEVRSTGRDHPEMPNHSWVRLPDDGSVIDLFRRSLGLPHPEPRLRSKLRIPFGRRAGT